MAKMKVKDYISFLTARLGTPYVYGAKGKNGPLRQEQVDWLAKKYPKVFTRAYLNKISSRRYVGKICSDCSGTVCWPWKGREYGSQQLYAKAYARLPMSQLDKFAPGTILYKPGHVGIYAGKDENGNPICIESKGIDYGMIKGKITNPNRWKCGLTFDWMDYTIEKPINSKDITYKTKNPYKAPDKGVSAGAKGESAKWVQYELIESGYGYNFTYNGKTYPAIIIDGIYGTNTKTAVKSFQESYGLSVTGNVNPETIKKMKAVKGAVPKKDRCPYSFQSRNVRSGYRGTDVLAVQWYLKNKFGYNIAVDGDFGSATRNAVKDFQKKHNLTADGIVGPATKKALSE